MTEHLCPTPEKTWFASGKAARRARGGRFTRGRRMRAYLCDCGGWHLTTQGAKR